MEKSLAAQDLLKTGIKWRVGNGAHIRIWKDRWLPQPLLALPIGPPLAGLNAEALVLELIDWDGPSWKVGLIRELFDLSINSSTRLKLMRSYTFKRMRVYSGRLFTYKE
jgi:hypothetical protein